MARDLQSIISEAEAILRPLLQEAFEAGQTKGRSEASSELRGKLADILGDTTPDLENRTEFYPPIVSTSPSTEGRSAPGTVKPVILRLIQNSPNGILTSEIAKRTGFKPNSVRGTLHSLKTVDHLIERRGDRWFTVSQKIEAVGDVPKQGAPTASDSPSGPVEAVPGGGT